MFIPLDDIYIPPEEDGRIRDPENTKTAVSNRVDSLLRFGQLQPILVEDFDGDKPYILVDGQIRYISMLSLSIRHDMEEEEVVEAFELWGMKPHHIEGKVRESTSDIMQLMSEFHANEDRDDFTWEEKGNYIRRIHELHVQQAKEEGETWTGEDTAKAIGQSTATVSQYLQLTDPSDPATQSDRVKKAKTKNTAFKQLKIEKEKNRRRKQAARVEKKIEEAEEEEEEEAFDFVAAAKKVIYHGDCRKWIKDIPDSSLSWFHWDPPYGGKEGGGGAFAAHTGIQTDNDYCLTLMEDMLPEIYRVLQDGSWVALWFTPIHFDRVKWMLQGHRFKDDGVCEHCERHIVKDYIWLSENYGCRPSPYTFWVNPYPNIWYKSDRVADGHEIQRFLTKQTEFFFLAGKHDQKPPILMRSNRGNVFDYPLPDDRRHVAHKPPALLEEVLSLISVPGSIGGDAGAGSGSIIEAAFNSNRRIISAELEEEHYVDVLGVTTDIFTRKLYSPAKVDKWDPRVS